MDVTPRWRHRAFLCYVALVVLIFLMPVPSTPLAESRVVDKVVHFGIFLGFALLFYVDRHRGAGLTFLISMAFAGGIELLQDILPYRGSDWLDFVAGSAGAGVGTLLVARRERHTAR
jgi:VanZ family protein